MGHKFEIMVIPTRN